MIVWGTKIKRKPVGWVADFCPLCRGVRPFRLQRVGAAGHIWYISLGSGRFLGNEIECSACMTLHATDGSRYASVSEEFQDLDDLVRRTLPDPQGRVRALVERERRVAKEQLSPNERGALIREAIAHGAGQIDRQIRERRYPPKARIVGWVTFGLFVLFVVLSERRLPEAVKGILSLLMTTGLFACFYFMVTRIRSHVRGIVEPAVARGLAPLKPTVEEIRNAIAHVRRLGSGGAKKLKPERLRDAIETSQIVASN